MKKLFTKFLLLAIAMLMGGVNSAKAEEDELIFTEDFSSETYNVTWGGTSAGGVSPTVSDGALTVANGSQSGDRSAYVSFGTKAYEGSAHLTFDMKMWKSGWSGKNNTFYIYPTEEKNRYPSRTDAVVKISQDANGAISINENALGTYDGTNLTYDIYLDAKNGAAKVVVLNGEKEIKTFNLASTATGIGAFHLTFNKNYGSFAIDNISLSKWTPIAVSHNYTVNAVVNTTVLKQLATGVANENSAYEVVGLPYVITVDGVCYKLNDNDVTGYKKSFTMGTADETKTVSYSAASDINYFFEAESILSRSFDNVNGAYSGGKTAAVYSGAALTMTSINAGIYTITVNSSVRRANEDILKVQMSIDGTNWLDAGSISLTSNLGGNYSATDITLKANGRIRLVESKSQNMCHYVDYVTLTKTGDYTGETITVDTRATYVTPAPLDFTNVEGVKAYVASAVTASSVTLTQVNKVAANEPIVLLAEGEVTVDVPTFVGAAGTYDNYFVDAAAATEARTAGMTIYAISKTYGDFRKVGTTVELPAGKAYLAVDGTAAIKAVVFDDDATAADAVVAAQENVASVKKFMKNGQLLIETANGLVNAAGAQVK
ncbi:MAG: hypothetical protein KBT34_11350 [Prevotella sp.]|nr:hypothetical protein [Candidatus Prevotella equi]